MADGISRILGRAARGACALRRKEFELTSQSFGAGQAAILVVRRIIRAPRESVFAAWTEARHLIAWWGPNADVTCPSAEIDLRVGGRYRIANRFPDGRLLWIVGEFEVVEPPSRLVFSWQLGIQADRAERVSVEFEAHGAGTEVIVTHERIADAATRAGHEQGWVGCLDGLARYAD
jgi:uncharacterized protein YndB with AHSA1/START domain